MTCVIRLLSLYDGRETPYDGQYVMYFNASEGDEFGECRLETTEDIGAAQQFFDAMAARAKWMEIDQRQPVRPDGKPNRPLTSFSISIETYPPPR